jgi:hypothetical protein
MQRLTARILAFVMLVGTLAPLTLARSGEPPHACCLRKKPHCHSGVAGSSELAFRSPNCDPHNCCKGLLAGHWAKPQARLAARVVLQPSPLSSSSRPSFHPAGVKASHAIRAPPQLSFS